MAARRRRPAGLTSPSNMNIAQPAQAALLIREAEPLSVLQRLFRDSRPRAPLEPLYRASVAAARDPCWYRDHEVPDTLDGRFDMLAAVVALLLARLEAEGDAGGEPSVLLTEIFIDDMDSTLRQIGIGDYVVGKHVGRMVGALGGRLDAFRRARSERRFDEAVRRNIFHDSPPSESAVTGVAAKLESFSADLDGVSLTDLLAGRLAP
jgi:cytochrome b pre-mRNA-processing protein 3